MPNVCSLTSAKFFLKKLFIGTNLGKALLTMIANKALLKGLLYEEVERGKIKQPPVPYIPLVDPIMGAVETKSGTKKLQGHTARWDNCLLCRARKWLKQDIYNPCEIGSSFCKRKNYYKFYEKAEGSKEDCF